MQTKKIQLALLVLVCSFLISEKAQASNGITASINGSNVRFTINAIAVAPNYGYVGCTPAGSCPNFSGNLGGSSGTIDKAFSTGDGPYTIVVPLDNNACSVSERFIGTTGCENNASTTAIVYGGTIVAIYENSGTNPTYNPETHIVDMQPETGSTTATNLVHFELTAFINANDAFRGTGVYIYLHNIDQNVLGSFSDLSPSDIVLYDGITQTPGTFTYSTTTYLGTGNYRLQAKLTGTAGNLLGWSPVTGCTLVGGFLNLVCQEGNTQFTVIEGTFIGNISQNSFAQVNSLFASTSATSTQALAESCFPWFGKWDTLQCISYLFVPDAGYLQETMTGFRNNVLTHFPLGYITDFVSILSTTTVGSLTVLDVTLPNGIPGTNAHLTLDLTNALAPLLNATSSGFANVSAPSDDTFLTITMYYWNLIIYIGTGLYILGRIIPGLRHKKHDHQPTN